MIADNLNVWDREDLARILADRYLDKEDLVEAIPEAAVVSDFEKDLLDEYFEKNWVEILRLYDISDLINWVDYLEKEEEYEKLVMEYEADVYEYREVLDEVFFDRIIEQSKWFHYADFGERCGYPPKKAKS